MTAWIVYGIPEIDIAIIEFIGKNEMSKIWIQAIWMIKPRIILTGILSEKVILPSLI